jgi:hypothetical protein
VTGHVAKYFGLPVSEFVQKRVALKSHHPQALLNLGVRNRPLRMIALKVNVNLQGS